MLAIHADHLGTPRAVTDSTGTTLWQWEGDAFGDVTPQLETVTMPLRMAGQYHNSETGLFYNYYRYYDPATGRYVRSDPIGLVGGMNTYAYVGGNPIMYLDPFGLSPNGERGASGGAGGQNSNNPYKHCREYNPPQEKFVQCKHHQSGKWIKKPRPPEMPFPNAPEMCGEECTNTIVVVGKVGATAGGAYLLYRCIRIAPSLFPPLWWSIPANLVTP